VVLPVSCLALRTTCPLMECLLDPHILPCLLVECPLNILTEAHLEEAGPMDLLEVARLMDPLKVVLHLLLLV